MSKSASDRKPVVQMSAAIEFERRSESDDGADVAFRRRFRTFLLGDVQVIDVSGVMFADLRSQGAHKFGVSQFKGFDNLIHDEGEFISISKRPTRFSLTYDATA